MEKKELATTGVTIAIILFPFIVRNNTIAGIQLLPDIIILHDIIIIMILCIIIIKAECFVKYSAFYMKICIESAVFLFF